MIGVDLVYVPEFKKQLTNGGQTMLDRLFHHTERANQSPEHLAGLWAAKEAIVKAADGTPGQWLQIEIQHTPSGRPYGIYGSRHFDVSIAHHGDYAVAIAQEEHDA